LELRKKCLAEFLGTFALVFLGTGAMTVNEVTDGSVSHVGIAVTFGLVVMAMIYALGNISGAHLNPAVTVGFWVYKKFPRKEVLPYVSAQVLAAILASLLLKFLFPASELLGATVPYDSALQCFILEFILTFFLMLVIINVSTGSKEQGLIAGIAIGAVVLIEAMWAGPITGASMNPARSIGPDLARMVFSHSWIYILAPVFGALGAVFVHRFYRK